MQLETILLGCRERWKSFDRCGGDIAAPDKAKSQARSLRMGDMSSRLLSGLLVLIADDNEDALEIVRAVLAFHGAFVIAATSAGEVLKYMSFVRPDVIVSDLAMPDLRRLQLLEQVHTLPNQVDSPTPVLALTAFVQEEHRSQDPEHGFRAFLPKPMDPTALVQEVARVAGKAA